MARFTRRAGTKETSRTEPGLVTLIKASTNGLTCAVHRAIEQPNDNDATELVKTQDDESHDSADEDDGNGDIIRPVDVCEEIWDQSADCTSGIHDRNLF